jgi:phage N-6-adenine-methyltransferase
MINKVLFSSNSDEWETPQDLFNELNQEFRFDLDVAATRENKKCKNYFSKDLDGLKQSWQGSYVFCNPPYSQISKWVKKASGEANSNTKVVMLLPARTDTKWFHKYIYNKTEIRFIKGRLKFSNSKNSAPFPSMIVIFNR